MANNFDNTFRNYNKKLAKSEKELSGLLGIYIKKKKRVSVPNRPNYVYVRLRDNQSEVIQAYNETVSLIYNLPVVLVRQGNRYVVKGKDTDRYGSYWGYEESYYMPLHGPQHSLSLDVAGGSDPTFIYGRQFVPLGVFPSGTDYAGSVVVADNYIYQNPDYSWTAFGITGTPDFTTYNPTGSTALMVLLYADTNTGNYGFLVNSGTHFDNTLTGTYDVVPYIPELVSSTQFPMYAIRLTSGTGVIDYPALYDVRQYFTPYNTGAAGGGGGGGSDGYGVTVQEDGGYVISGSVINFVGEGNLDVSSSGTIARVYISGTAQDLSGYITGSWELLNGAFAPTGTVGGGGGTAPNAISIYDNTSFLISGSAIHFDDGLTVVVSGTHAHVSSVITGAANAGTYQLTGLASPLDSLTGTYWQVPGGEYASGSLAVFYDGLLQAKGIHYNEQYPVSGTYQYLFSPATGTNHMTIFGVLKEVVGISTEFLLLDSDG